MYGFSGRFKQMLSHSLQLQCLHADEFLLATLLMLSPDSLLSKLVVIQDRFDGWYVCDLQPSMTLEHDQVWTKLYSKS